MHQSKKLLLYLLSNNDKKNFIFSSITNIEMLTDCNDVFMLAIVEV